jgi:Ribbon-helix-helix domain
VVEKRVSMTFRLTAETYEWLRRTAFETRVSQQALVDKALDRLRSEDGGG